MIELTLIPDGSPGVPVEATDHAILASHLEESATVLDDPLDPLDGWRDISRVVPGSGEYIALRAPGQPGDYSQTTLDGIRDAVVDNINGLKAHPDGWTAVDDS